MKKQLKKYVVNFDMRWSYDIRVSANSKREARIKAWLKFFKMIKQGMFNISVDDDQCMNK